MRHKQYKLNISHGLTWPTNLSYPVSYFKNIDRIVVPFASSSLIQYLRIFPSLFMKRIKKKYSVTRIKRETVRIAKFAELEQIVQDTLELSLKLYVRCDKILSPHLDRMHIHIKMCYVLVAYDH